MRALLGHARRHPLSAELACFAVLVAVALAWCAPALVHGAVYGSFDTALSAGLGSPLVAGVHDLVSGDQARQDAVWLNLNWVAVHHGALPLWNPFSDLGLPELANLQSAPASLSSLIAYLFPLSAAYTVEVVVKLLVGGMGCYVAARVLRTSRTAALLAGVVGELAGPMAAWAGWPQTGVAEWTGWVLGLVVLACRKPGWKSALGLAVVVAFACAGGFPEVLMLLAIAAVVQLVVVLVFERLGPARRVAGPDRHPRLVRQLASVAAGALGGLLLSAPVWVPALPVLHESVSSLRPTQSFLGLHGLALFVDPSFWGLPTTASTWFGPGNAGEYYESAAFVGPLVLCCALVAVVRRWRQPAVVGLAISALVVAGIAFGVPPLRELVLAVPGLRTVAFGRGLLVVCDVLAVLAAVGLDELRSKRPRWPEWGAFSLMATVTVALAVAAVADRGLTSVERDDRLDGLWLALAALAVLGGFLAFRQVQRAEWRSRCWGALSGGSVVVVAEAAVLVLASFTVNTWSRQYLPRNGAVSAFASLTTGGLVALGGGHVASQPPRLGIYPELNAAYGVRELAGYDAITPKALYSLWVRVAPAPDLANAELAGDVTQFAPDVQTAAEARVLGVSYLVEPLHGSLRLVDGATACVSAALARGGADSTGNVTGILDDLEWLVEQPGLLRKFPSRRPGYVVRYLAAEVASPPGVSTPPVALGVPAAQAVVALEPHHPQLEAQLEACTTTATAPGLERVATVGTEALYRVPGPAGAYFSAVGDGTVDSSLDYTGDATAKVAVSASRAAWLTVAIDGEPGWSAATASGTRLEVRRAGALLQVLVPRGSHVVVLDYWPEGLTAALWLSFGTVAAILAAFVVALLRRRRRSRSETSPGSPPALGDDAAQLVAADVSIA
ncbi:MAG: Bacterial rane protein YfhO [Acidimicrobiaceae bacterium]|nr:Bacterial rane protein YfhO [Acidimicrobiaceae bacterium]